jgi:plastocyanin
MRTRSVALAACVVAPALISACSLTGETADVTKGKTLFVSKCGSCHTLSRAGTTGVAGPNLDEAFQRARRDGFGQSTFAGMVEHQIKYPPRRAEMDPQTKKPTTLMPADLVTGAAVTDVAQYVAQSAGKPGKDTGALAQVGGKKSQGTAREKNGTLSIPVVPGGQLAYVFTSAQAKAGKVTIESKNPQGTAHDIAIEGNGVNAKGAVVQNGGTSRFTATLKPGTYTFFCSVDGHRQGGMVGKLTVK